MLLRLAVVVGLVSSLFACGSGGAGGPASVGGDDAGADAGTDGGTDAGTDGGTDAGTDGGTDAGTDGGTDAGTDGGTDAGTDGGEGACAGVVCEPLGACHPAGACDPETGACVSAPAVDGTPCTGGTCAAGVCVAAGGSCTDGVKNGTETDVDCGGPLCPGCVNTRACAVDSDCLNRSCANGRCATLVTALVADPGPRRSVAARAHVMLDGTRSRSPMSPIATWAWAQTAGPAVTLTGANGAYPSFDAPVAEAALKFTLTVGDGASTASADLEVLVRAADRPAEDTSLGLILDAMSDGSIDRDTAMTYLAWSASGDPRLPSQYQGTRTMPSGTAAMHVIASEFPTLSPEAQEAVRPLLLTPAAPGSLELHGPAAAAPVPEGWVGVSSAHYVIWFRPSLANGFEIAKTLSKEAESKIWPRLQALFGEDHMPVLNDRIVDLEGGTHGKLNVYLKAWLAFGADGVEIPFFDNGPTPSIIELKQTLPMSGRPMGLFECLAHETTHACQDSYHHTQEYSGHRWIYEGTATWAQDYVYPATNTEHESAPEYLRAPWLSLEDDWSLHPYGTYLFFQSVTRPLDDADFVRRVFENFRTMTAVDAVEHALPLGTGYRLPWRGFVAAEWNRDPASDFRALDGLTIGAQTMDPGPVQLEMKGDEDFGLQWEVRVRHLAADYMYFAFPDPTVRQIFFYDGYQFKLMEVVSGGNTLIAALPRTPDPVRSPYMSTAVHVKRELALEHEWERVVPPPSGVMLACQDDPAERIQELAIGFGYGYPVAGDSMAPEGLPPRLWMSNIGCYRWSGTATGSKGTDEHGPAEETSAQVTFLRDFREGMEVVFSVAEGSFTWKTSGTYAGCSYSGSASWTGSGPQEGGLRFATQITDGPARRGYEGRAYGHEVEYQVTCPDGSGGTTTTTEHKTVFWLNTVAADGTIPQVSADGLLAAGAADDGAMLYTWSFASTPE